MSPRAWILSALLCHGAAGWDVSVLRDFEKPGANTVAPLIADGTGGFLGVSSSGGASDAGVLFRVDGGDVQALHQFTGNGGDGPAAGLVSGGDGNFYGSTSSGGSGGFGLVFRYSPATGEVATVHDFAGGAEGSVPGALAAHSDGFLYGVTRAGGNNGHGTVFRISTAGAFTTLHHFTGTAGSDPCGPLVLAGGIFHGLCRSGGTAGVGTAFRITTAGGFTHLFDFTGGAGARPGASPDGGLVLHSSGKLVGTTEFGGSSGFGTAFTFTTDAVPVFTALHSFSDPTGSQPVGSLVEGNDGQLYGACAAGGGSGFGNLFRLSIAGVHAALHDFAGVDGASPRAGLTKDAAGVFHGVTSAGGPGQLGVVFSLTTAGVFAVDAAMSPTEGFIPSGAPVSDGAGGWVFPLARGGSEGAGAIARYDGVSETLTAHPLTTAAGDTPDGALTVLNGTMFGIAARGGSVDRGTAFTFDPGTGATALLADFNTSAGSLAEGPLTPAAGALFGVAREGGASARGTFYRLTTGGTRTRIVSFTGTIGTAPGRDPRGPVVLAPNQSFYGITALGGASNTGVIYKVNALGTYSQIAAFGVTGPRLPDGGLTLAADGLIYGTCRSGGADDAGVLIRIDPANDTWETVVSFDPATASEPVGGLLAGADGAVTGVTASGHVFRFAPATGLEILADLGAPGEAADESNLIHHAGIAELPDGALLVTTPAGGAGGGGGLLLVSPPPPDTPLAAWKLGLLGSADAPNTADPDGDRVPTIVEYALDTDPSIPGVAPQPVLQDGRLQIVVPRNPEHSDVIYIVEVASDLDGPWLPLAVSEGGKPFSGPGYVSGDAPTPGIKAVLLRDLMDAGGGPRRFLRFRVMTPDGLPLVVWKQTHFGDPWADDHADPDHDGRSNLLEYFAGTLPNTPDTGGQLGLSIQAGQADLALVRDPSRPDITIVVEAADTLSGPWEILSFSQQGAPFTGPAYLSGETGSPSPMSILLRDPEPVSGRPSRFFRIHVTR
ncbi:MAG: hypothetical protein H7A50_10760 [Akkermansiaceae bacterium]|nr:hypothetical protein [Akkermansiaceae bacterium]